MSDNTLGWLFRVINGRRNSRLGFGRTLEQASPSERPQWNMRIAAFDQEYFSQLAGIEELPDILAVAPHLKQGWPYPSEYTLDEVRVQLAAQMQKSVQEIDQMP